MRNQRYLLYLSCVLLCSLSIYHSSAQVFNKTDGPILSTHPTTYYYQSIPQGQQLPAMMIRQKLQDSLDHARLFYLPAFKKKDNADASRTSSISLNAITIPSSCGNSNGTIIITASGGTEPYLYTLNNWWSQNTGNFPSRSAGTYTITVTDATGLSANIVVTLTNNLTRPSLSMQSITEASSCSSGDASVTLKATGGVPPYTYSLDLVNFQSSNVFTNLAEGAYDFFVKDANGCTGQLNSFNFGYLLGCGIPLGIGYATAVCTNTATININALDSDDGPYTYSIDGGPFVSNGYFENLGPGVHQVMIRYANGEQYLVGISIFRQCNIIIDYISVEAACQGSDGTLTVFASNGTPPYSYTIDGINFQFSNVYTGLYPGNYNVTVKDANGITNSLLATVYDRCPEVSAVTTDEGCAGNDGIITATGVKGAAPFTFSIDGTNFQSSAVFTGLAAGTYTVTIKDALGFTATTQAIVKYSCLEVTAAHTNAVCGNPNGSITATGSGGVPPYQYSLDGINFQAANVFSGLTPAGYTLTIKDQAGATAITTVTIGNTPRPGLQIDIVPPSCDRHDGRITLTAIGGTAPFEYSINNVDFYSTNVFTGIVPGDYTGTVRDANGCYFTTPVNSVAINCPEFAVAVTFERCNNANGALLVAASRGTPPYEYSLDGINFQTSNFFPGLVAGDYTVTVRDALAYTNSGDVTVERTCPVVTATVTDATCGLHNGTITASGSGGLAPYQYSLDGTNFQTGNVFTGLAAGQYTVTIKDTWWTSTNTTIVNIGNTPAPQLQTNFTPASCVDNDGIITLSGSGSQPLQFSIDGNNFQAGNIFRDLPSGNYTAFIKDANNCIDSHPVIVTLSDNLQLEAGADLIICEGNNIAIPAVSNGTVFNWWPSTNLSDAKILSPVASPVVSAKYYITAELGACVKKDSVIVNVNKAPVADAGANISICKGQNSRLHGNGGVIYMWSPATYLSNAGISDPEVIVPASSISYQLQVTDANGCSSLQSASVTVSVTTDTKVFAGNDTSIVMNQPFKLQPQDINGSGFVRYSWSPSYGLNDPLVRQPVAILDMDVNYVVTAYTAAGCSATDEVKIKVYQGPEIYVPTAFTPNDDGKNDILKALPVGISQFRYFVVYNRWGQRIFYTANPALGWDGRIQGQPVAGDTYVWMAEGIDDKGNTISRKGTVTIVR